MMSSNKIEVLEVVATGQQTRVIAITGGKGGVGKTNITVNLARTLAKKNKRVLVFDADLGLGNVDVMLGLNARKNLSHVLKGEVDLKDIILDAPGGFRVIPAASGLQRMCELSQLEQAGIIQAFNEVIHDVDIMLVDTAAGISSEVANFVRASQEIVMVVCNEPTSITDSYASMKVLSQDYGLRKFYLLANMVSNAHEGQCLYNKLNRVAEKFLDINLAYAGMIPFDSCIRKSVQKQQAFVSTYPGSKAALAIEKLSNKLLESSFSNKNSGSGLFFVEQLIRDDILLQGA